MNPARQSASAPKPARVAPDFYAEHMRASQAARAGFLAERERWLRDFAQVEGDGRITQALASDALTRLGVDASGLDAMDRKILLTILDKFGGGPVGVETIAAAVGEQRDTIEDVCEPFLLQEGFLQRTPRGRTATHHAYSYFNKKAPTSGGQGSLW